MKVREKLQKYLGIPKIRNLYDKVRAEFEKCGPISHNWDHIYRDIINAIWIGEAEGADMSIVLSAVILHDIGFLYDTNPSVHHILGAERCVEWLNDWSEEDKRKISSCIKTHKGKVLEFNLRPKTLEEKVVHDADLLEKTGWIGVLQGVRTFVEFAEGGAHEFKKLINIVRKLANIEDIRFYTKTGQKLAKERGGYVRGKIFKEALKELKEYE